ncbi:uncharacterized protein LOC116189524 [Punica granatum]|uniref:Thionin-like protein 2 n=2 Tax=Punica granatum TaxID=22663 RepID=A0A218XR49_PUNGR|nr:uncharacterized protein LOC116189524 [Punica granatum]OWM87288.1 hypothetical protein CDL15_Pgr022395 [Punica granatum]PKI44217.1 hypothetical protein CRG98_035400 [Punica granatum]
MEGVRSRVMIAVVVAVLLASCSTYVDALPRKNAWLCKVFCEVRCGPIPKADECILECMDGCINDKASPLNNCNFGCVMTSCLDNSDPESKRSCGDSCSKGCQESYAQH